ncbi:MAG TPA: pilus assembly protein PilM [Vicinamibacterales bacterium]
MSPQSSLLGRWFASAAPTAALEIDARRVTAVAVSGHGASRVLAGYATQPLAPGAVEATLNGTNVHDQASLARAIRAALDALSPRPRRLALVLPDTVAKVSLLRFDKIPAKPQDLEQLIRWQIRKSAPFKIEDAQLSWFPGTAIEGGGREFVVTAARRDIIESYERACEAAGAHAGIVDLATMNLVNAVIAASAPAGDWLLVHAAADYATIAVVRGRVLIFFRNRVLDADEDLAALVHQTAMYHQDRLGGGAFARVVLAGASSRGADVADRIRRSIEERLGAAVEPFDLRGAVALRDRIAMAPELADTLAPAVGVIVREQVA